MREIGIIPDEKEARRFADYLLTLDITTRVDPKPDGSVVWVHREERVEEGRQELKGFLDDPSAERYRGVEVQAITLRRKAEREERKHVKNSIPLSGRWDGPAAGRAPLTIGLIAACVAVGLISHLGDRVEPLLPLYLGSFRTLSPEMGDAAEVGLATGHGTVLIPDGLSGLHHGQVWRLVTPIFIHYDYLHILFNMLWLYQLGSMIESRKGSLSLLGLILAAAVASNLGEYAYSGALRMGGMSGVVYALLGFIWMGQRYDPAGGLALGPNTVFYMILWLLFCMTGRVGNVANAAHVIGLVVGVLVGIAPHLPRLIRRWM